MLDLSYNFSESCYVDAAKRTFEAADKKELCEKIDVRFSYGQVSADEYQDYYDPNFWQLRKVTWVVSVPFRLTGALFALINSSVDVLRNDQVAAKANLFSSVRCIQYAAADLIFIFNDRLGQQWATEASAHIKLYQLAWNKKESRLSAFEAWFVSPEEKLQAISDKLDKADKDLPGWFHAIPKE